MKTDFLTPVGRLVQGDPFEAQTKNQQGQPLRTQSGEPTQRYFIAVAFPKMVNGQPNAEFAALWQKLEATGRAAFPGLNLVPPWDPACRFSWKVADGDGVDDNGKPNANKEGFAGHWVVKFSSSFAPRCFHAGHYQPHEQIQDPKTIKRGYFVRVAGTIEGNGQAQKPGIYVNLSMVELAGQGAEIVSGPDAAAVFGGAPVAQLPAGATPLPMHAQPLIGAAVGMLQQMAAPAPAQALPAPLAVAPHPGILGAASPAAAAPAGLPIAGALPVAPLPGLGGGASTVMMSPTEPRLTPQGAASGMTYAQMIAQGYTADQLRAGGYIV